MSNGAVLKVSAVCGERLTETVDVGIEEEGSFISTE